MTESGPHVVAAWSRSAQLGLGVAGGRSSRRSIWDVECGGRPWPTQRPIKRKFAPKRALTARSWAIFRCSGSAFGHAPDFERPDLLPLIRPDRVGTVEIGCIVTIRAGRREHHPNPSRKRPFPGVIPSIGPGMDDPHNRHPQALVAFGPTWPTSAQSWSNPPQLGRVRFVRGNVFRTA